MSGGLNTNPAVLYHRAGVEFSNLEVDDVFYKPSDLTLRNLLRHVKRDKLVNIIRGSGNDVHFFADNDSIVRIS